MKSGGVEIQTTSDGSDTLYIPLLDEHYHSIHGAVQESMHVYIDSGFNKCLKNEISVLEIGFGTGLNTYLTLLSAANTEVSVYYTCIELYPLPMEVVNRLNYVKKNIFLCGDKEIFLTLHECLWNQKVEITPFFSLNKICTDFSKLEWLSDRKYDVIYFDAFAPDKQPEMWTQDIFDFLFKYTNTKGILTTYCAKGAVRRMMKQSGYIVERIPGPPGKREMLRAVKETDLY